MSNFVLSRVAPLLKGCCELIKKQQHNETPEKNKSPVFRLNTRAFSSVVDKSNEVAQSKIKYAKRFVVIILTGKEMK